MFPHNQLQSSLPFFLHQEEHLPRCLLLTFRRITLGLLLNNLFSSNFLFLFTNLLIFRLFATIFCLNYFITSSNLFHPILYSFLLSVGTFSHFPSFPLTIFLAFTLPALYPFQYVVPLTLTYSSFTPPFFILLKCSYNHRYCNSVETLPLLQTTLAICPPFSFGLIFRLGGDISSGAFLFR